MYSLKVERWGKLLERFDSGLNYLVLLVPDLVNFVVISAAVWGYVQVFLRVPHLTEVVLVVKLACCWLRPGETIV